MALQTINTNAMPYISCRILMNSGLWEETVVAPQWRGKVPQWAGDVKVKYIYSLQWPLIFLHYELLDYKSMLVKIYLEMVEVSINSIGL